MKWENSALESIVGKRISSLEIADSAICFVSDGARLNYELCADCCSVTWLHRVINVAALIGQTVTAIVEISTDAVDVNDGLCRQDYDTAYGIGIRTDLGVCQVLYRNSSNGYYGGWIERSKEPNVDTTPITQDFDAAETPLFWPEQERQS